MYEDSASVVYNTVARLCFFADYNRMKSLKCGVADTSSCKGGGAYCGTNFIGNNRPFSICFTVYAWMNVTGLRGTSRGSLRGG